MGKIEEKSWEMLTFCWNPVIFLCSSFLGKSASQPVYRWPYDRWWQGPESRPAAPRPQPPCFPGWMVRLGGTRSRPTEPRSRRPEIRVASLSEQEATAGQRVTPSPPPRELQQRCRRWHHALRATGAKASRQGRPFLCVTAAAPAAHYRTL